MHIERQYPTLGQHQQQRPPHPLIVLKRNNSIKLNKPKRNQEMQIEHRQLLGHLTRHDNSKQQHRQLPQGFDIKITQIDVVEEGRERVSIVLSSEVVEVGFVEELLAVECVEYNE